MIIQGNAGIGKTHLSVSVSKYVHSYGKNVIFINSSIISDNYQKSGGIFDNFLQWIVGYDLIVLDDINSRGSSYLFLEKAIEYVYFYSKAILITSNIQLEIDELLPINFDPNCLFTYNSAIYDSYRTKWLTDCYGYDKLNFLFDFNQSSCGIIINNETIPNPSFSLELPERNDPEYLFFMNQRNINIDKILLNYKQLIIDSQLTINQSLIRITGPSAKYNGTNKFGYYNSVIGDTFVHGIENYKFVIIYVSKDSDYSYEQLVELVLKVYNKIIKILVVTPENKSDFSRCLIRHLNRRSDKLKAIDRIKIIFPGIIENV